MTILHQTATIRCIKRPTFFLLFKITIIRLGKAYRGYRYVLKQPEIAQMSKKGKADSIGSVVTIDQAAARFAGTVDSALISLTALRIMQTS